jgi:ERCC4-type nuclease
MIITVDTREKPKKRFTFEACGDDSLKVIYNKLEVGDYSLYNKESLVCVEKKESLEEITRNLIDKADSERFANELEKMKTIKYSYLVTCFSFDDLLLGTKYSKVTPNFIISLLLEIQCKYNVRIMFGGKRAEFLTYKILKKHWDLDNGIYKWKK